MRWIVPARMLCLKIIAAYARYDFAEIVQALGNFCSVDLGALYLDVTKDRLYTLREDSPARRSAQSAMYRISEAFVRWIAPILSFTADEMWAHVPGQREARAVRHVYDGRPRLRTRTASVEDMAPSRAAYDIANVLSRFAPRARSGGAGSRGLPAFRRDAQTVAPFVDELRFLLIRFDGHYRRVWRARLAITATRPTSRAALLAASRRNRQRGRTPELCVRCVSNVKSRGNEKSLAAPPPQRHAVAAVSAAGIVLANCRKLGARAPAGIPAARHRRFWNGTAATHRPPSFPERTPAAA